MDWQKYLKPEVWHPAAKLFPLMGEKELAQLAEDIRRYRLLHPITLIGELVLDGRNRLLACAKAGVEPWFAQFNDQRMGPVQWVISQNFHRRHLTSSQATTVALEALPLLEEEAKGRREATSKYASRDNKGKAWHPAARLFPLMGEKELVQLAEDIRRYRLLHPITLIGELVLDGRNRLLACAKAGVEPWFAQFNDQRMGPVAWVISQNFQEPLICQDHEEAHPGE